MFVTLRPFSLFAVVVHWNEFKNGQINETNTTTNRLILNGPFLLLLLLLRCLSLCLFAILTEIRKPFVYSHRYPFIWFTLLLFEHTLLHTHTQKINTILQLTNTSTLSLIPRHLANMYPSTIATILTTIICICSRPIHINSDRAKLHHWCVRWVCDRRQ